MSGEPVPADEHGYAWAKVVEQGKNRKGGRGRESKRDGKQEDRKKVESMDRKICLNSAVDFTRQ